jgi:hypothetical protein
MRSGQCFSFLAALLLVAAVAVATKPAAAQQLLSGMTGPACAARGGQITTWTNTAGRGPNVGDCYIPPRFGGAGVPSSGGRAGAALGAGFMFLDALSNLLDSAPDSPSTSEPHSDWDDYLRSPEYQREKAEREEEYARERREHEAALNDKTDEVSDFIRSGPAKPKAGADPCAGYPPGPAGVAQCYQAAAAGLEQQAANCSGACRAAMLRAAASARCVAALRPANADLSATLARCGQNPAAGLQRVAATADQPKAAASPRQASGASQGQAAPSPPPSAAAWQKKCEQLEQAKDDSAISCWGGLSSSAAAGPKLRAYAQQRAQRLDRTMTFEPSADCPYGDARSGLGGTQCLSNTISEDQCSKLGGIWYPSLNGAPGKCLYDRRAAANAVPRPGVRQPGRPRGPGSPAGAGEGDNPGDCGADCGPRRMRLVPGECSDIGGLVRDDGCWVMGATTSDCEDVLHGQVVERAGYKYCRVDNVVLEAPADDAGGNAPERHGALRDAIAKQLAREEAQQAEAAEEAAVAQRLEREWYADAVARYKAWVAAGRPWSAEDIRSRDACAGSWSYDGTNPGSCDPAGPKRAWEVQFGQAPATQQAADGTASATAEPPPAIPPCDPTAPSWHVEDGSPGGVTVVSDPARRCKPIYGVTVPKPGEKF